MKIKFSNLAPNDIVWVCYDKNHGNGQECIYDINVTKGIVKINEKHKYTYSADNYYDTVCTTIENFISIQVPDIKRAIYERTYSEFDDEWD